jgi:hypothetical protein
MFTVTTQCKSGKAIGGAYGTDVSEHIEIAWCSRSELFVRQNSSGDPILVFVSNLLNLRSTEYPPDHTLRIRTGKSGMGEQSRRVAMTCVTIRQSLNRGGAIA